LSTIHLKATTTAPPRGRLLAALTDFGPGRLGALSAPAPTKTSRCTTRVPGHADVDRGPRTASGERLQYDWTDPNRIVMTTTDSNNLGRQVGAHVYHAHPRERPAEPTSTSVVVAATARTSRVTRSARLLGVAGKRVLGKAPGQHRQGRSRPAGDKSPAAGARPRTMTGQLSGQDGRGDRRQRRHRPGECQGGHGPRGAEVIVAGRDPERLERAATEIGAARLGRVRRPTTRRRLRRSSRSSRTRSNHIHVHGRPPRTTAHRLAEMDFRRRAAGAAFAESPMTMLTVGAPPRRAEDAPPRARSSSSAATRRPAAGRRALGSPPR